MYKDLKRVGFGERCHHRIPHEEHQQGRGEFVVAQGEEPGRAADLEVVKERVPDQHEGDQAGLTEAEDEEERVDERGDRVDQLPEREVRETRRKNMSQLRCGPLKASACAHGDEERMWRHRG